MRGSPFVRDAMDASGNLPMRVAAWQEEEPKKDTFVVEADLLIPGKGEPIEDGFIVVEGNKITNVGTSSSLARGHSDLPKYHVKVLMPGMWDWSV